MRKFFYIIMAICPIFFIGCEKSSPSSTTSSVAQLSAFSFAAVDSMPGLSAEFTVEERLDTGLVWNKDSMLYGTKLNHVVPRFSFAATPGMASLTTTDTVCALTGYDTLDFTKTPIYLTIRSSDRTTTKVYEIRPTVHQVDPELFTWTRLTSGIYPADDSEQKVVELGSDFVMIVSNGYELRVFRSPDGESWPATPAVPTGLPAGTHVRQIISDGTTLYYGQGNNLYTSTDAVTWTPVNVSYSIVTMLLYWNEEVWALVRQNDTYELATWQGTNLLLTGLQPTDNFPVSDFASVAFQSASGRDRAMIIGGFAENGQSLNTRWNLEYSIHPLPAGSYRLEEFSIDRPESTSMTGISVVWYNNLMMLFGGVDDKMTYFGRDILLSIDEGLTWTKADTAKNQLPEVYQARQKQNAIVRDNDIYLFGGQDAQTTHSDVYRGRLNSIDW